MTRQKATLSRGHFTAWMITLLKVEDFPVGDNNIPVEPYGWQGQPNDASATFTPWMSVGTGTARPSGGSFGDSASEHVLSFSVTYNGVTRDQTEWLADKMRKEFGNAERSVVDCGVYGSWKIQQVQTISVGGIQRIKTSFPDYYVQTDAFDIWVSKENT